MSSTAAALTEEKGGRPARHSNNTTPSEYRSVRPSTSGAPSTCSGLMYSSVPTMKPLRVTRSSPELAIASSGDDRVTRSGFVVGTEEYMSPEQVEGAPDVDGRTDLYSLGVVLFECLAGRPPFSSVSAAAVLDMHQHRPAPDVRSLRRDIPKPLSLVLARALAKTRDERWQTAAEMREELLPCTQPVA